MEEIPGESIAFDDDLFDLIPDPAVLTDADGFIVRANVSAAQLFSCPQPALLGRPMEDLVSERFRGVYARHRAQVLDGGTAASPELEVYALTGTDCEVPIDATATRVQRAGSTYILLLIREVSDRVATQERLERRLSLDRVVMNVLGRLNAVTVEAVDEQVNESLAELCKFVNADRCYIFQKSNDGSTISNTHEWCAPGVRSRIDEFQDIPLEYLPWISQQIDQRRVVEIPSVDDLGPEARIERVQFRRHGIRSSVNVPMIASGQVIGVLGFEMSGSQDFRWQSDEISTFVVVQDFIANALQRKQAGAELQRANRMLQAVTECNDALVRAVDESTLLQDVCRIVVEAGGYMMAWVGTAMNDQDKSVQPIAQWGSDGGYVSDLRLTWADAERGTGPAGTAIRTRSPVAVQNIATDPGFEFARAGAMNAGFASTIAVPYSFSDETVGVLSVYAADVAAFDEREVAILQRFADDLGYGIGTLRSREAQQQAEAQLRESLRSKNDFLATVAHELRTPLAAVVGFAQILKDDASDIPPSDRTDMIRMICDEGIDLTNIIDDLMVSAKAEAGILTVSKVSVDLRAQAAQVLESLVQRIDTNTEFVGSTTYVTGDPARVRQVIRNLVSNAARYGGNRIRVSVISDDLNAQVIVADNGPGVPTDDQEDIFEPYKRAHNAPGLTASMGLGLTISRQLARLMGGDLTYSRVDGESVFALALPVQSG